MTETVEVHKEPQQVDESAQPSISKSEFMMKTILGRNQLSSHLFVTEMLLASGHLLHTLISWGQYCSAGV